MASESPGREKVVFWLNGYTVDATGVRIWPLSSYRNQWADLEGFEYVPYKHGREDRFRLKLNFGGRSPRKLRLECGGGPKGFAKIACALQWMKLARPGLGGWKEPLVENALGAAAAFGGTLPPKGDLPDDERLDRARYYLAALRRKAAAKDCAVVISHRSKDELPAGRLKIRIELADNRAEDALDTLADLLGRNPDETEARAIAAEHLLMKDDGRGATLAAAVLERNPTARLSVASALAGYLVRRRRWDEAAATLSPFSRIRSSLGEEERAKLDKLNADISRLRENPSQAFREVTIAGLYSRLRTWLPIAFVILVAGWPLVVLGPTFLRNSRNLWKLRDHGVRADLVRVEPEKGYSSRSGNIFITTVFYEYAPDRAKTDPPTPAGQASFPGSTMPLRQFFVALQNGLPIAGWYQGQALVFDSSALEIRRDPALQFVTYLPENPSISTIGPITQSRIWFTWIGVPRAMLTTILVIGSLGWAWIRPLYQRWRRRLQGFEA